jgi:hypothetical protein
MSTLHGEEMQLGRLAVRYDSKSAAREVEFGPPPRDRLLHGSLARQASATLDACLVGQVLDFSKFLDPFLRQKRAGDASAAESKRGEFDLAAPRVSLSKELLDEIGREVDRRGVVLRTLSLEGWNRPVDTALRSLSLRVAEQLECLNLDKSLVEEDCLLVVQARYWRLKRISIAGCKHIGDNGIRYIVNCAHRTLVYLDITKCPKLTVDAIGWIAGELGTGSQPACRRLETLRSGSNQQFDDRAWRYVKGGGLSSLKFLDLSKMEYLTDMGMEDVCKGCRHLEVLDVASSWRLTDETLRCVALYCKRLRSIGLTRLEWITDRGLWHLSRGCTGLQTVDVAGCYQITELGLFFLGMGCKLLQKLRADGDHLISSRGVRNLAVGLGAGFVEPATKWHGLKPVAGGATRKIEIQLGILQEACARRIQGAVRCWIARRLTTLLRKKRMLRDLARGAAAVGAVRIRQMVAEAQAEYDARSAAALLLTVRARAAVRRMRLARQKEVEQVNNAAAGVIDRLKATLLSQITRKKMPYVHEAIMLQRRERRVEAGAMAILGIQGVLREYQAHAALGSLRWEFFRKRQDWADAALRIQCQWRVWVARQRALARRTALMEFAQGVYTLGRTVQRVWRGHVGRSRSRWMNFFGCHVVRGMMWRAASIIAALWHGHLARLLAGELRRERHRRIRAAIVIQRNWLGSKVPSWKEIAFVALRQRMIQDRDERYRVAQRYRGRTRRRQMGNAARDSASDEGSDDDWEPYWDDTEQRQRWYSADRNAVADRMPVWRLERMMVRSRTRIRVFWPAEGKMFEARVVRWVPLKQRFKIEYLDGEVEYIALHAEYQRVMVYWNNIWTAFASLPHEEWRPPGGRVAEERVAASRRLAGVHALARRAQAEPAAEPWK